MADTAPEEHPAAAPPPALPVLRSPFDELLGLQYRAVTAERVVARLDVGPRHHQPFGIVHGGVYSTIVETVASIGAYLRIQAEGQTVVGLHNATDFIRAHAEGPLTAVGEPIHVGRSQQLWQVVISRQGDDKTVARGQVRLAVVSIDQL